MELRFTISKFEESARLYPVSLGVNARAAQTHSSCFKSPETHFGRSTVRFQTPSEAQKLLAFDTGVPGLNINLTKKQDPNHFRYPYGKNWI